MLQRSRTVGGSLGNKLRFSEVLAAAPLWSTIDCNLPFSTPHSTLYYSLPPDKFHLEEILSYFLKVVNRKCCTFYEL